MDDRLVNSFYNNKYSIIIIIVIMIIVIITITIIVIRIIEVKVIRIINNNNIEIRIEILQGASLGMGSLHIKVIVSDIEGRDYNSNNTEVLYVIVFL